jgi:hypothetical protein
MRSLQIAEKKIGNRGVNLPEFADAALFRLVAPLWSFTVSITPAS